MCAPYGADESVKDLMLENVAQAGMTGTRSTTDIFLIFLRNIAA